MKFYENTGMDFCNTYQQDAPFHSQFAFMLADCPASQHKLMTIPIAVYTEKYLLMMSSKPARNS